MEDDTVKNQAFRYQLDTLTNELNNINSIISRINDATFKIKNWAIVIWAGSIALILGNDKIPNSYLYLTSILPLMFWFIDAWIRRTERSFIYRTQKISEFINGDDFIESFKQQRIINFKLVDYRAKHLKNTDEYKRATTVKRTFMYKELSVLYFSMFTISITLTFVIK